MYIFNVKEWKNKRDEKEEKEEKDGGIINNSYIK